MLKVHCRAGSLETTPAQNSSAINVHCRSGSLEIVLSRPVFPLPVHCRAYMPITSKQRFVTQRVQYWAEQGRKTIVYAHSPASLQRMDSLLTTQFGIDGVLFTGLQDVKARTHELDSRFRFGDSPVLLASKVANRGLNLEQASVVIFYDRGWSPQLQKSKPSIAHFVPLSDKA